MAIQMRRGEKADFDPAKMLPGEWAVSVDTDTNNQVVWMCFAAGVVKQMGTYEDFRRQIEEATEDIRVEYNKEFSALLERMEQAATQVSENTESVIRMHDDVKNTYLTQIIECLAGASEKERECKKYAESAGGKAKESEDSAMMAKSYVVGGTGVRLGEDTDSAKYYKEESERIYNEFNQAGTVTGVKGNAETDFHTGNVNITPANIGAPSNEYMEEHFVPDYVSSVRAAIGSQGVGWYRIAKAKDPYYNSCVITLKRSYNTPGPEYQRIQLMNVYDKHKFVSLAALSYNHIWTKIRETWDADTLEAYLEVYLNDVSVVDGVSKNNNWLVTIEDALNATGNNIEWKAITPVKTEEVVSGFSVIASLDLPANFDLSYLVNKNGDDFRGFLKFIQNGVIRFIPPDDHSAARGMEFYNKDQSSMFGGIGVYSQDGNPKMIYMGAGTDAPWTPANGLSITGDAIKWKNSNVLTEASGTAYKAARDGDGNVIKDSYAVRKVVTDGDCNDMVVPGIYTMRNSSNTPDVSNNYCGLLVMKSDNGNYVEQIAFTEGRTDICVRYLCGGPWGEWTRLLSEDDKSELQNYKNLTNKPTTSKIQHGSTSVSLSVDVIAEFSVSFSKSFSSRPNVVITPIHNSIVNSIMFKLKTVTTSGFTGQIKSSGGGTHLIDWIAIGD